ncbi:MAG: DUF1580 domain-containing protein [Tepidisphaeraceae bacterium]|jgi:hypothetical protein
MHSQPFTDTGNDRLIRLHDVPRLPWLPARRGGSKLNVSTIWRWAMKGAAGVKLPTVAVGSALCTTERDLRDFFAAVADARRNGPPASNVRTPRRRQREIAAAEARLAAAGIR